MSMEGELKPPAENFISDLPFGITLESIQNHFREIEQELAEVNEALAQKDTPEGLRKFAEDRKASIGRVLEVSPGEIFRLLQEVYNFVSESEQAGLTKTDILLKLKDEKPDLAQAIGKFYGVLRSQVWGYRLGQELFAFRAKRPS